MLSVRKEYGREDLEILLNEQTSRMGLPQETLYQEIHEGMTLQDLLCEVVGESLRTVRARESAELRRRQREGMTRAQERGVTLGRPSKRSDRRFEKIRALYERKSISAEEASKRLRVSISTFYRWLRQSRKADKLNGESTLDRKNLAKLDEEDLDEDLEMFDDLEEDEEEDENQPPKES